MTSRIDIPDGALLRRYRQEDGAYTDCYETTVPADLTLVQYVTAFYTTRLFKLERIVLRWLVRKPSSDADAEAVAHGTRDTFAAWRVEARTPNELLMCDFMGRTRSWFRSDSIGSVDAPMTRLYFGSAVVPARDQRTGELSLGGTYSALLGFHRLYSHALLRAARTRILAQAKKRD
jgi:hypothetical protein